MKPNTPPQSDLEIARAAVADAINRNASGIAATTKNPAPFDVNADYKAAWRNFWTEIVAPNGEINLDQVQRELSDYARLLDAVPRIYMHATGGQVSKPLTDPSVVCDLIDEHVREAIDEAVRDSEAVQLTGGIDVQHDRLEINLQAFDAPTFTEITHTPPEQFSFIKSHHLGPTEADLRLLGDPPPNVRKAMSASFDVLADFFTNGQGKPNPPGLIRDTPFNPPRSDPRVGLRPNLPAGTWTKQHPDDAAVDRFAAAMKAKLAAARAKGRNGWNNPNDPTDLNIAKALVEHMVKGNAGTFEDVANFCMFLHQRGASPGILQHVALYTPATNFQRNTLLDALREVRLALQLANKQPGAAIVDTIWMPGRPETLFDFIDTTLEGLFPDVTGTAFAGARNMRYAGLFEDETEEDRAARLALADAMMRDAKGKV